MERLWIYIVLVTTLTAGVIIGKTYDEIYKTEEPLLAKPIEREPVVVVVTPKEPELVVVEPKPLPKIVISIGLSTEALAVDPVVELLPDSDDRVRIVVDPPLPVMDSDGVFMPPKLKNLPITVMEK